MTHVLIYAVGCLALIALVLMGARYIEQKLLYQPSPDLVRPEEVGLRGVRLERLATSDGAEIVTWYAPAQRGQPTILYFHGNAGDLAMRADRMTGFIGFGQGIMMMAYRSYSGSTGTPSEAANVADGLLAFDTLVAKGIDPAEIVLYGESLGTGVAVQVARARKAGGLILDAPYTSIVDVAKLHYPFLPSRLLMRDRYDTLKYIKDVMTPLLIIHGGRDNVIPIEMGRRLLSASPGEKQMVELPLAGHSDHFQFGSFDAIQVWLGSRFPRVKQRSSTHQ